ncbi:unnamed protein product [Clonostachys rosea]|uniref:DNA (cytosine-5-)-methyltransferase n=1 Tax=Bionectria ochroleuca TaxID=29856 RepID=A0ABY6U300_BIOOC|nr:unnamed protein product [Clonostachys rosea]
MDEVSIDGFFDPDLQAFFDNPFMEDNLDDGLEDVAGSHLEASLPLWDDLVVPAAGQEHNPIQEAFPEESLDFRSDGISNPDLSSFKISSPQRESRSSLPAQSNPTIQIEIPQSTLLAPRSCYEPFEPEFPIKRERDIIQELLPLAREEDKSGGEYLELQLDDFAVYNEAAHYGLQMRSLHQLDTKDRGGHFYFDGVLRRGDRAFFAKHVPIKAMPIQNYGDPAHQHTVRDSIWLESPLGGKHNLFYRLGKPAFEYSRFFQPFLWVADLAKHFVDYLDAMWELKHRVSIHDFRLNFYNWLRKAHGGAKELNKWLSMHPSTDYRTSIVANIHFLFKEAIGVLDQRATSVHLLWKDLAWDNSSFQRYEEIPESLYTPLDLSRTVVTPYIFDCFKHLPFGDRLDAVQFSDETQTLREKLIEELSFNGSKHGGSDSAALLATKDRIRSIKPGDTISTHRDSEESGSKWQRETSKDFSDVDRWFARVQQVSVNRKGQRCFDVSWYYRPVDTLCGLMKYPWENELFLSDHCSCEEKFKIMEDEVLGVHDVHFHGSPSTSSEFFCRLAYIHQDRKWISLEEGHLVCEHVRGRMEVPVYSPGDTVLVRLDGSDRSEPCEVLSTEMENSRGRLRRSFTLRKLLRRSKVDRKAQAVSPNELVYSDELITVRESRVMGPCYVRFFPVGTPISRPYDRNGVGNLFVLRYRLASSFEPARLEPLTECPRSLRQGFAETKLPPLRGLDLFCGGGNFGRGLEEAGCIKMLWANDYVSNAIHTYMANVEMPEEVHPFLGSIDILQKLALEGHFSKNIPAPGEVDFISGGSPCPGFSSLTNDKTTVAQRKNQSLVAAFASSIDLYRPKYGLLENVTGIVQKKANRDQDVFSQLICAVVGLGYQTQFYFLDASSCGSPQRRSRVFLAFAAPGYKLPDKPQQTHSHPDYTNSLSLGKLPNGEPMAEREWLEATPFKFTSAAEATADLPSIQDGKPDICVPFPDHRVSIGQTRNLLLQMYHIPTRPFGMNFAATWYRPDPLMTRSERESFYADDKNATVLRVGPKSNAFGRQRPDSLIETVVTRQSPGDGKSGRQLHWRENRALTLMEARRAQGFRDEDVLLGAPSEQYRIVGNSVARQVAVALGIAFREAYAASKVVGPARSREVPIVLVNSDIDTDIDTEATGGILSSTSRENSRSETPLTSASETNYLDPGRGTSQVTKKRKLGPIPIMVDRTSKITKVVLGGVSSKV